VSKKKPLYTAYKAHHNDSKSSTWISSVAALHNTDLIASGSNDGYIRVWACAENFFKFEEIFNIKIVSFCFF
jgi:ribosomal RNA-processing protein 9